MTPKHPRETDPQPDPRSEAWYRALVEGIPAVIYEMDPDDERRTVYVSPHVVQILGYSRQEWLDQPDIWTELLHPDDRETELAAHDLHNQTGEPWNREYRLIANDGRVIWVRDQAALLPDQPDRLTWHGVMLDITAQKEAQANLRRANDELELRVLERTAELLEANEMMTLEIGERRRLETQLRETQERYRQLVEHLPGVVYIWQIDPGSHDTPQQYTSPQLETLLGYTPAQWDDDRFWRERLHPHDRERVEEASDHSARTGEPFSEEYRYLAKDGRVVWVLNRASLLARSEDGRPDLFQGVMLDITARKEAQEKAREVEARFSSLTEHGPAISYLVERKGDPPQPAVTYVSPQVEKILGYPRQRFIDDPYLWVQSLHPDDGDWVLERSTQAWDTGEPWSYDFRMIAADGRVVWLHGEGLAVVFDGAGTPITYQGVLLDITERKRAEDRQRGSDRGRTMLEQTPGVPWMEVEGAEPGTGRLTYFRAAG
jgi:adenylate cyclase